MHSHHSHSGAFCAHASVDSSPSSMLSEAYRKGFKTYCLSEHVPRFKASQLYPEEVRVGLTPTKLRQQFEEYLVEARRCAAEWKHRMNVLVGAELENIDEDCIGNLQDVLDGKVKGDTRDLNLTNKDKGPMAGKGRVDYLIGSLHHVDSIPIDFDQDTFEKALNTFRLQEEQDEKDERILRRRAHLRLILQYLEQQGHLLNYFQPEVVGHFDLCRLFQPDTPMTVAASSAIEQIDSICATLLQRVDDAVHKNIDIVCSYNGLFEINSASLRKGWNTPYPGEDVLDAILAKGGRLCLSDDAHSHEQVGLNFQFVKQYLKRKRVAEIWTLTIDNDPSPVPKDCTRFPRGTKSVKIANWTADPFWHNNNLAM